jgi:hypothetical protein
VKTNYCGDILEFNYDSWICALSVTQLDWEEGVDLLKRILERMEECEKHPSFSPSQFFLLSSLWCCSYSSHQLHPCWFSAHNCGWERYTAEGVMAELIKG